jgi:hypothetical protein
MVSFFDALVALDHDAGNGRGNGGTRKIGRRKHRSKGQHQQHHNADN